MTLTKRCLSVPESSAEESKPKFFTVIPEMTGSRDCRTNARTAAGTRASRDQAAAIGRVDAIVRGVGITGRSPVRIAGGPLINVAGIPPGGAAETGGGGYRIPVMGMGNFPAHV